MDYRKQIIGLLMILEEGSDEFITRKYVKEKLTMALHGGIGFHPLIKRVLYSDMNKKWFSLSEKQRIKALKSTGSHTDDFDLSICDMGGSQQDAMENWMEKKFEEEFMNFEMFDKCEWDEIEIGEVFAEKHGDDIDIWAKIDEKRFIRLTDNFSPDWEDEGYGNEYTLETANPVIGWWALYKLPKHIQKLWLEE